MAKKKPSRRIRLGDFVELKTRKGYFYAQYINDDVRFHGELVRVLPGASRRPRDVAELAATENALWCCFWPVRRAVKAGEARFVGNATIPKPWQKMPTFKWSIRNVYTGKSSQWTLWNGTSNKVIRPSALDEHPPLTEQQRTFPILEIIPTDVLVARLENGWMPENDCTESPKPSSLMLPVAEPRHRSAKRAVAPIELLDNDATSDFLADVAGAGMSKVRHAIEDLKRAAAKEPLERDDANIVMALAVICLAKQGIAPRGVANTPHLQEAVKKCRGPISGKSAAEIAWLLQQVLNASELRDLLKEAGELKPWSTKVTRLLRQLEAP